VCITWVSPLSPYVVFFILVFLRMFCTVCCLLCEPVHLFHAPYGLRRCNAPWFMCWFWRSINCLFVCLHNLLLFFLLYIFFSNAFFLTYLLPCLFTSWLIYLLLPEYTCSVSRPEIIGGNQIWLWLFGSFYVVIYYVCFCSIFSTVFQFCAKRLAGKHVSEMTYFVLGGT